VIYWDKPDIHAISLEFPQNPVNPDTRNPAKSRENWPGSKIMVKWANSINLVVRAGRKLAFYHVLGACHPDIFHLDLDWL
jgi:hypothetical protein